MLLRSGLYKLRVNEVIFKKKLYVYVTFRRSLRTGLYNVRVHKAKFKKKTFYFLIYERQCTDLIYGLKGLVYIYLWYESFYLDDSASHHCSL